MRSIICTIIITVSIVIFQTGPIFSDDMDNLAPKAPPVLPIEDFTPEHDLMQIGGSYMKQEIESDGGNVLFKIYGITANGVSTFSGNSDAGWGFGAGVCYLSGTMDFDQIDADLGGIIIPMGIDLAWRPKGTPEGSNLMLFGGISGSYILFTFSTDSDTTEYYSGYETRTQQSMAVTASGFNFGLKAGAKAAIAVGESFKIVPYIFIQRVSFSMSYSSTSTYTMTSDAPYTYPIVQSSSDSGSINSPAVNSIIYGFDLLFGDFSVGTMLDILKSDNKSISFSASYKFPVEKMASMGQSK